ncbi:hypothetical protein [Changchengzhania lutea]|uniref:hypothetical protein n=1 Tax=Changchengzhania lutea TaxID=2049305 RepID=UPI00163DD1D0|nr:hypothetical protein [Changchengzhania lutea]
MPTYIYTISNPTCGVVTDENKYIVEKRENKLSSDVSNIPDDDKINSILDL